MYKTAQRVCTTFFFQNKKKTKNKTKQKPKIKTPNEKDSNSACDQLFASNELLGKFRVRTDPGCRGLGLPQLGFSPRQQLLRPT
jgi:hypothetical protein